MSTTSKSTSPEQGANPAPARSHKAKPGANNGGDESAKNTDNGLLKDGRWLRQNAACIARGMALASTAATGAEIDEYLAVATGARERATMTMAAAGGR
jgi:hypothetical protein